MSITGPDDDPMILDSGLETGNSRVISVSGGLQESSINPISGLGLVIGMIVDIGIALDALAGSSLTISVPASSGFFVVVTIYIGSPSIDASLHSDMSSFNFRDSLMEIQRDLLAFRTGLTILVSMVEF
ncbi:hypothetical protein Tco_0713929 [Tanacetum coccineum]